MLSLPIVWVGCTLSGSHCMGRLHYSSYYTLHSFSLLPSLSPSLSLSTSFSHPPSLSISTTQTQAQGPVKQQWLKEGKNTHCPLVKLSCGNCENMHQPSKHFHKSLLVKWCDPMILGALKFSGFFLQQYREYSSAELFYYLIQQ